VPVRFLAGEKDIVIAGRNADQLTTAMKGVATDFRGVTLYPGAGHWVQHDAADRVNEKNQAANDVDVLHQVDNEKDRLGFNGH